MERMRLRALTTLLAVLAASVLAACGGDDDQSAETTAATTEKTAPADLSGTLKIAAGTEIKPAVEKLIQAYRAARPNVDIKTSYAVETQYNTQIKAQLSGSQSPDVLIVLPGTGNATSVGALAKLGVLEDASDQPWVDEIPAAQKAEAGYAGKTYFFPLGYDPMGLVYDAKVWEKEGMTPPKTFSELLQSCDEWRKKGYEPIAVGMKESFVPQFITYALIASTVYRETPDFDTKQAAGEATFADSGWRTAFEKYVELEKAGCFNKGYQGNSYDEMLAMVTKGKAAMTVTVSASLGAMREAAPDGKITMAVFPTTDEPEDNWVGAGTFAGFAVSKKAPNKELAFDFLKFINAPEQAAKFANEAGAIPPGDNPDAPGLESIVEVIQDDRTGPYPDHFWPNPDVQATHNAVVQQIFTGQTTIDKALESMDKAYAKGG
jgi:ABC-type glycerol-3-phosphate transport system substrate-binding protein